MFDVCRAVKRMPHPEYCAKLMDIKTEEHVVERMVFGETQLKLDAVYERQMKEGRGVGMIVLKGRKIRCSTWAASRMWRQYLQNPGWSCLLAADTTDRANILFDMVKVFKAGMPQEIVPECEKSNAKLIRCVGWKSDLKIATANEGEGIGRGATLGGILATEFPYWHNKRASYNALMSGFVRNRKSIIVWEGTANGRGYDEELYFAAKKGEADLEAVFIAWHELKEYQMLGEPLGHLDEEERTLKAVLNLSDEQLRWRRYAIRNNCGNNIDTFHQEFPSWDHEAYLSTGTPYFNNAAVNKGAALAFEPMARGRIHLENGKVHFEAIHKGHVQIWEYPTDGKEYIVAADPAGARTGKQKNDMSTAYVYSINPLRCVAMISYNAYEDIFANDLILLAEWYKHALLAPESNGTGHAVVVPLMDKYDNLYCMKTEDKWYPGNSDYPGWYTSTVSRPIMLNRLHQVMRENPEIIPDKEFWDQASHFVKNTATGRVEADVGYKDDRIFAAAIGISVWQQSKSLGTRVIAGEDKTDTVNIGGGWIIKDGKGYARLNQQKQSHDETNIITADEKVAA